MQLSDFIRRHSEDIAKEWEDFARTSSPSAARMNVEQLRDHILPLLRFVADDMDEPQTKFEQKEKAHGNQPSSNGEDSEAQVHAGLRMIDGFTVDQVVGEFRALRASILSLWSKYQSTDVQTEPDQITRFNESIDQMLNESVVRHAELEAVAREQSQRRDAFLATLSHELRNPLATIINGVQLVTASAATNPSLALVAAMMHRQAAHMMRLLDDLLDLARISRDRIQLKMVTTDLRECVQDALDANRAVITQKAHVLKVDMPQEPIVVACDCTRIMEVVSNLLNNAAKYSPTGSNIEVSLSRDEQHVMISVKDDGTGIDTALLPRIFDAFYFSGDDNVGKSGLGIGLWLTRNLVELHAGTIVVRSEGPGRGAEFCVKIPLRPGSSAP